MITSIRTMSMLKFNIIYVWGVKIDDKSGQAGKRGKLGLRTGFNL